MSVQSKRVYDPAEPDDGYRVLVDRIWPRGLSRERAALSAWEKELAPSTALRKAFHGGELDWAAFQARYLAELKAQEEALLALRRRARGETVTLLFASKDAEHNNAVVLQRVLQAAP